MHPAGVANDWVQNICVGILIAEVGTPSPPLLSDLRVESRHVERAPGAVEGVTDQHDFIEQLKLGSEVDDIHSRNGLLNARRKVGGEMVMVDGKTCLQAARPVRSNKCGEVKCLPVILVELV